MRYVCLFVSISVSVNEDVMQCQVLVEVSVNKSQIFIQNIQYLCKDLFLLVLLIEINDTNLSLYL